MKIFRKGFLVLLAAVVVAGLVFTFLLEDRLFAGALRRYGPQALQQPLDFAAADLDLVAGRAAVEDLVLGPAGDPILRAGELVADASPWDLLNGRVRIQELALRRALLRLEVDENGRLSVDPGPPPPGTEPDEPAASPPPGAGTPPEERDIVQILGEYWDRLQRYRAYYDRVGLFGGGEEEAEEAAAQEAAPDHGPVKPPWLETPAGGSGGPGFWIGEAGIEDLAWETLDRRTGKPILPPVESFTFQLLRLGDAPPGIEEPGLVHGEGRFAGGGALGFDWQLARDEGEHALSLHASGLPLDAVSHLVERSIPYRLAGGSLDLDTGGLRFSASSLAGTARVVLNGTALEARPGAPDLLGISAGDFAAAVSRALRDHPVALEFELGGTPTRPTFKLQAQNLDEVLRGAVESELRERGEELLDDQAKALQEKAGQLLGDKVPDAGGLIEEGAGKLGGLLGGRKKGGGKR